VSTSLAGKTIRIYLAEGSPSGVLLAEVGNWTGKLTVCPRTDLAKLNERPDTKRTGLYFLAGPDPEKITKNRVYVGESDNAFKRLIQHDKDENKDFWNRAVIITSKDENLTKAHVRYLESRLIELTSRAGRAVLANSTSPDRPALPEPDIADMEYFLGQVRLVLPVLGFTFTEPVISLDQTTGQVEDKNASPIFAMNPSGTYATAQEVDGRFIVFAGSTARKEGAASWDSYRGLRDQLVQDGKLDNSDAEGFYCFTENVEFASPSAAATVVNAGNQNGRIVWKVKDTGQSYRDWQDAKLNIESLGNNADGS